METMAAKMWEYESTLIQQISEDICRFDFYQAVRILENLCQQYSKDNSTAFPIRFKGNHDLNFYGSPIASIKPSGQGKETIDMVVNFFGLTGIDAPMPNYYIQEIKDQEREQSGLSAMRSFFDLINHQLIKLRYDVRKQLRVGFQPQKTHSGNSLHSILYNLLGLLPNATQEDLAFPYSALLSYTALLHGQSRSLHGLEVILSDYFKVFVQCQSLTGSWQNIALHDQNRLGIRGRNQNLGTDLTLGKRVLDLSKCFTIYIHVNDWNCFEDFLPTQRARHYQELTGIIDFYTQLQFDYDYILRIAVEHIPTVRKTHLLSWSSLLQGMHPDTRYLDVHLKPSKLKAKTLV